MQPAAALFSTCCFCTTCQNTETLKCCTLLYQRSITRCLISYFNIVHSQLILMLMCYFLNLLIFRGRRWCRLWPGWVARRKIQLSAVKTTAQEKWSRELRDATIEQCFSCILHRCAVLLKDKIVIRDSIKSLFIKYIWTSQTQMFCVCWQSKIQDISEKMQFLVFSFAR